MDDRKLPPLPDQCLMHGSGPRFGAIVKAYYTAAQLRAYAEEAVKQERERSTIWCPDCGDGITAHDPGVCGNCLAMKYDPEDAVAREREACAKAVEALRDDHCKGTQCDPDPEGHCLPDDNLCDFVASWNDAASVIRARSGASRVEGAKP